MSECCCWLSRRIKKKNSVCVHTISEHLSLVLPKHLTKLWRQRLTLPVKKKGHSKWVNYDKKKKKKKFNLINSLLILHELHVGELMTEIELVITGLCYKMDTKWQCPDSVHTHTGFFFIFFNFFQVQLTSATISDTSDQRHQLTSWIALLVHTLSEQ